MSEAPIHVLFISRRNSLRSVLAEATLNHLGGERFHASSAGMPAHIASALHAGAVGALLTAGIEIPAGPPRSWSGTMRASSRKQDFVICLDADIFAYLPAWPGQPDVALWDCVDAAALPERGAMIAATGLLHVLKRRLEILVSLPLRSRDRVSVRSDVVDLGRLG